MEITDSIRLQRKQTNKQTNQLEVLLDAYLCFEVSFSAFPLSFVFRFFPFRRYWCRMSSIQP